MSRIIALVGVCLLALSAPAGAQNIQSQCLSATTSGDAIINCMKASILLQREQTRLTRELLKALTRRTNPSLRDAVRNTAVSKSLLERIAGSLLVENKRAAPVSFFGDLSQFADRNLTCSQYEPCEELAPKAADKICKRLGFALQQAHAFESLEAGARLTWVVCRQ